jgi:tripartite-type tricarboxylate transporter receptor subunit TctC
MKKGFSFTVLLGLMLVAMMVTAGCGGGEQAKKDDFPNGPITIYINYSAGGSTDLSTRAYAQAIEKVLGQPVTVINKAGGTGTTSIIELKKAKNNGYILGTTTYGPMAILPHTKGVPYTIDDFDYVCSFGEFLYGIAVRADSPYKSIDDLVKAAKAGKRITNGCSAFPNLLAMEGIGKQAGVKFIFVPYGSGNEASTALLGGHVDVITQNPSDIIPYVKTGEMRFLASAGKKRWSQAPDVPTLIEQGYNVSIASWIGIGAPKGVPANRLKILRDAFKKASEDKNFQDVMIKLGFGTDYLDGDTFKELLKDGSQKAKVAIDELGMGKKQ